MCSSLSELHWRPSPRQHSCCHDIAARARSTWFKARRPNAPRPKRRHRRESFVAPAGTGRTRSSRTSKDSLVELACPARIGSIVEVAGEGEIAPPTLQAWSGKELGVRIGGAVLIHIEVTVNPARGHDVSHASEYIELPPQLISKRGW